MLPEPSPQTGSATQSESKVVMLPQNAPEFAEVSEDSVARAFTQHHKDSLRFDHDLGRWFLWDGWRWAPDRTKQAYEFARREARRLGRGQKALGKASVAAGVERFAQSDNAHSVTQDVWDRSPLLIGTPGGTLDLQTGHLRPPKREDFITKLTSVAPENLTPERWLAFLDEATGGDIELIRFLQQFVGYCLTGLTKEHTMLFLYGPGGNGKSVFLNIIQKMLNEYSTTASMETFAASKYDRHPAELAALRGARLVVSSETEEGRVMAEARIKSLTGGDPITARFMRQNPFTFDPTFKIIMAGNHEPKIRNVDEAMKRRFRIVPFTVRPRVPNKGLESELTDELPAILQWAVEGCLDWQKHGLICPSAVFQATDDYFMSQDPVGAWLDANCEMDSGNAALVQPVSDLFDSFSSFAAAHDDAATTRKAFGASMKKLGFESRTARVEGKPQKVYDGLKLRTSIGFSRHDAASANVTDVTGFPYNQDIGDISE